MMKMDTFTTPAALLQNACPLHGFEALVLTDADGFALAYGLNPAMQEPHNGERMDTELVAATSAMAWRMVQQMQAVAGLDCIEECTFSNQAGRRMVCRLFYATGQLMILVALLPTYTAYRRVTTTLVHELKQLLEAPITTSKLS